MSRIRWRALRRCTLLVLTPALSFWLTSPPQAAQLMALHHFNNTDGASPDGPGLLAQGRDGNLYGTTSSGGGFGVGVAFKLTPTGRFTQIYNFGSKTESSPRGGLTLGHDGNFYGTTWLGGTHGNGTVFKLTRAGTMTVLHHFSGPPNDGCNPAAPPVEGYDGNFYGTTVYCGAHDFGSVYKITPTGRFSLLHSFAYDAATGTYPHGYAPESPLIQGYDGAFYGTAPFGGHGSDSGVIFRITTQGSATTLYNFDGPHGHQPFGPLVQGADGSLYGTTLYGGANNSGTVFKVSLKGVNTVLHAFDSVTPGGQADGFYPYAGLAQGSDGAFYGATMLGGTGGKGVLYRVTAQGSYAVESSFDGANGANPVSTPRVHTNGRVYGLTKNEGSGGYGSAYRLAVGAPSFIVAEPPVANVGASIGLLGAVGGADRITFNGINANFSGSGRDYRTVVVPAGAATGPIKVRTPSATLRSLTAFQQRPTLAAFSPRTGPAGGIVVLMGTGLTQTTKVTFGGGKLAHFVVDDDSKITATVPVGATRGRITVTTQGGRVRTARAFTLSP